MMDRTLEITQMQSYFLKKHKQTKLMLIMYEDSQIDVGIL